MLKNIFKKASSTKPSNRELFDGAISMGRKVVKNNPDDLQCLLKAFGKKIQYDYLGNFFCHAGIEKYFNDSTRGLKRLSPETLFIDPHDKEFNKAHSDWFYNEIQSKIFTQDCSIIADLSKDAVLPWPWKSGRILDCLNFIGEGRRAGDWSYDDTNHELDYWEELGLFFVYGGNHSIATGILKGEGEISVGKKTSLRHMYDHLYSDGDYYYRSKSGEKDTKLVPVRCLDFAILYELGRIGL